MKASKLKKIIGAIGQTLIFAPMLYMAFQIDWMVGVMATGFVITLKTIE